MAPIVFVAVQLLVIGWMLVAHIRRDISPLYRGAMLAAFLGVIGMDVWYFANFAYPAGFGF